MTNRTDDKKAALLILTGESDGQVNDLEKLWLESVITSPVSANINDLWVEFWLQEGYSQTNYSDMAFEWLGDLGYTGAYPDRWAQYWAAGGGIPSSTMEVELASIVTFEVELAATVDFSVKI